MPENPSLELLRGLFIHLPHRLSGEFLHGGKALALGRIRDKDQGNDQADNPRHGRRQEAPLPSCGRHDEARHHHRNGLAQLRGRTEDAVPGSALIEREPAGQADGAGRRTHGLHPAVHAPKEKESHKDKEGSFAQRRSQQPQDTQNKVNKGRYANTRRHKTTDVAIVCNETVGKLSYRIHKVEGRPYEAQFPGRKHATVDERLLDHAQGTPAHVVQGIGHGHAPEGTLTEASVGGVHLPFRNGCFRRFTDAEIGKEGHYKSAKRVPISVPGTKRRACRPTARAPSTLASLSSMNRISPAGKPMRRTAS